MNAEGAYLQNIQKDIEWDTTLFATKVNRDGAAIQSFNSHPYLKMKKVWADNFYTIETAAWLAKAEYIISEIELPPFYMKRKNQIYIQIFNFKEWNNNIARLMLHADFIVKQQEHEKLENIRGILNATILPLENIASTKFKKDPPKKRSKKNIVMYCGGFKNNGITSSAINLMKNINKQKYQIIVVEDENLGFDETKNLEKVPDDVIKIQTSESLNLFPEEEEAFFQFHDYPLEHLMKHGPTHFLTPGIKRIYQRELKRLLGDTKVDVALDFDGYFKHWTLLMASSNAPNKIIFQHNEMMQEYSKKLNNAYKHRADLNIVFPLYNYFDRIVSVAKPIEMVNKRDLQHIVYDESKMTYVHNSIDYPYILQSSKLEDEAVIPVDTFNFVTMGRLSPEKNQQMMIAAFQKLQEEFPDTNLFIIGSGELEDTLKTYVTELSLDDKVHFLGQLDNPFATIAACDAFLLSSIHEGQPMVLLECLVLNKPILATDTPGCAGLLKGYGLLARNDVENFVMGMKEIRTGYKPPKAFDYKAYNQEAIRMLEEILEMK